MPLIDQHCTTCGPGAAAEIVYPATIRDPEAAASDYYLSSRTKSGYLRVLRCCQCGLWRTSPRDDDEVIASIYHQVRDRVYLSDQEHRYRTALRHMKLVNRHADRGRILDVGCSTGLFVQAAVAAGWTAHGIDASEWAISQASALCPTAAVRCQLVEDADLPKGYYDAVTLWDVLEHVRSPRQTLEHVWEALAPGGCLFLNVPNAASRVARVMGKHWVLLLREHLWYFTPYSLGQLLIATGFEPVSHSRNDVTFSIAYIAQRMGQQSQYLRWMTTGTRIPLLARIGLRFPIGEMTFVARRPLADP